MERSTASHLTFALAAMMACGSRSSLDTGTQRCGHAVAFSAFGDDVLLNGVDATPWSGFTWDFWFRADTLPSSSVVDLHAGATMIVAADSVGCEDIYVGFGAEFSPANRLAFNVDGAGSCAARDLHPIDYAPAQGFVTGRWYFVAVSHDYSSGASRLYVDGVLVATGIGSTAPITRTLPVTLGRWTDRDQYNYNELEGAIDELHMYARVLTDVEVSNEYAGGAGHYGTVDAALVAGFHFDEGTGNSASDYAITLHTGALEKQTRWVDGFSCGL